MEIDVPGPRSETVYFALSHLHLHINSKLRPEHTGSVLWLWPQIAGTGFFLNSSAGWTVSYLVPQLDYCQQRQRNLICGVAPAARLVRPGVAVASGTGRTFRFRALSLSSYAILSVLVTRANACAGNWHYAAAPILLDYTAKGSSPSRFSRLLRGPFGLQPLSYMGKCRSRAQFVDLERSGSPYFPSNWRPSQGASLQRAGFTLP